VTLKKRTFAFSVIPTKEVSREEKIGGSKKKKKGRQNKEKKKRADCYVTERGGTACVRGKDLALCSGVGTARQA